MQTISNFLDIIIPFVFGAMFSFGVTVLKLNKDTISNGLKQVAYTEIACGAAGLAFCFLKVFM